MDETTPHIHAMIIPVVDGKLNAKKLIGGPAGLRKHQESYAKAMVPLGLEARTKYSVAKHEDIKKFYTAINDAIVEKLPAPLQHESVEDYFERAQGYFEKRNLQNLGKQRELEHMIIDAKNSHIEDRMDYVHLMSELENMRQMMGDNIEEMRKKIKLMDYINAGLKLHPSKEFAQATKDAIQELVQIAKDHELEQEQNESTALRG
jgi:hypothetical protein